LLKGQTGLYIAENGNSYRGGMFTFCSNIGSRFIPIGASLDCPFPQPSPAFQTLYITYKTNRTTPLFYAIKPPKIKSNSYTLTKAIKKKTQ